MASNTQMGSLTMPYELISASPSSNRIIFMYVPYRAIVSILNMRWGSGGFVRRCAGCGDVINLIFATIAILAGRGQCSDSHHH